MVPPENGAKQLTMWPLSKVCVRQAFRNQILLRQLQYGTSNPAEDGPDRTTINTKATIIQKNNNIQEDMFVTGNTFMKQHLLSIDPSIILDGHGSLIGSVGAE